jgi:type 1 glutamine amidotransferase
VKKPVSVLLLTGANNHDWKRSAPFFKTLLENSGRFTVTVAEDPSSALADVAALDRHDLLFVDYNGPAWSAVAQANFLAAVKRGKGLVAVHAANNSFPEWEEYAKLLGLMWRTESSHGEFHEFEVKISDHTHPITQGVAGFRTMDELYHKLVPTRGLNMQVLATAWSDLKRGGTGRWEPVMTVTDYGRGRVFYHALGHIWAAEPNNPYPGSSLVALQNPGFQNTLLRGCEWAATGTVTIPPAGG